MLSFAVGLESFPCEKQKGKKKKKHNNSRTQSKISELAQSLREATAAISFPRLHGGWRPSLPFPPRLFSHTYVLLLGRNSPPCRYNQQHPLKISQSGLYERGTRRMMAYVRIGFTAAMYPILILGLYLGVGAVYIIAAYRKEPFYQRLATLLLVSSYDWFDSILAGEGWRRSMDALELLLIMDAPPFFLPCCSISIYWFGIALLYRLFACGTGISTGVLEEVFLPVT